MIDIAVFLLGVLLVAAAGVGLWGRLASAPRSRARRRGRWAVCVLLALPLVGYGAFHLSRSRSWQLFGDTVRRVETADSVVALTFDDGPVPVATARVLAILQEEGVRATFYLNGGPIEEHPEQARRIVQAGHEVGNHTFTHPRMVGLSLARIRREVEDTDAQIRRAGYRGPIHFRAPYGKRLVALPWYLARTGRLHVYYDVEPESFAGVDGHTDRIVRHVLERTRPGSIILLHVMFPSRAASMEAVRPIVRGLRARGYRFVTVSELLSLHDPS